MIKDDSIKLAEFWTALYALKEKLDNELIPIGGYLGIQDQEIMIALGELSLNIRHHFEKFRLVAEYRKSNGNFPEDN